MSNFYESLEWIKVRNTARSLYATKAGLRCHRCGVKEIPGEEILQVDHIFPKSLYPEKKLEITNTQILCKECNQDKSNKHSCDYRDHPSKLAATCYLKEGPKIAWDKKASGVFIRQTLNEGYSLKPKYKIRKKKNPTASQIAHALGISNREAMRIIDKNSNIRNNNIRKAKGRTGLGVCEKAPKIQNQGGNTWIRPSIEMDHSDDSNR